VVDFRYTYVVVNSKLLFVNTTFTIACGILVSFAIINDRYTLIRFRLGIDHDTIFNACCAFTVACLGCTKGSE